MTFEREPKPPVVGELLATVPGFIKCATCGETPVPDKYYGSKCACSPVLPEASKAHLDNIEAARNAWEVSDRAVPFPDYWAGWQAATKLIDERALREATLAGQLNAALRKKNTELETANKSMRGLMRKRHRQHESRIATLKGEQS